MRGCLSNRPNRPDKGARQASFMLGCATCTVVVQAVVGVA